MTHDRWVREDAINTIIAERKKGPWPVVWRLLPKKGRLLEVGCSAGFFIEYVHDRLANLSLTGVDISPSAVELAAKRDVQRAQFRVADGRSLPFANGSFDVVYSGHFVEHMVDPVPALQEQRRVLVPRGMCIVHFPHGDKPYVEHVHDNVRFVDVRDWLEAAGFRDIDSKPVVHGPAVDEGIMWGLK